MVAEPRGQVPQVLVAARGGLRRRAVVQAWSTALLGLVRGCQHARPVPHVTPLVAHPLWRAPGLLGTALAGHGDGG
jgi:hypothetical protein